MDVITAISAAILTIIFLKNIARICEKGEAFVKAFKEVHQEIEEEAKTNPYVKNFGYYDPYRTSTKK